MAAALRRDAAAAAPAECCGALIGVFEQKRIDVRCAVPVPNVMATPDRYTIDAETVLRLERRASSAGLQLIGFYHSHALSAAAPSPLDMELACPGFLYVIVQAHDGTLRGWRLHEDRSGFGELPVSLRPTDPVAASPDADQHAGCAGAA